MNVVFVVLHYCQVQVTQKCIESLLNLKGQSQVVVVDNASPDASGKILEEKFKGNDVVHVILNEDNLGFATANNIGYAYAKNKLGAEVIVVINNDTVVEDKDFVVKLLASPYLKSHHVIAPDIVNRDGCHQNPKALFAPKYDKILKNYRRAKINRFLYSIPIVGDIKAYFTFSKKQYCSSNDTVCEMIVPHGAAIIYSPCWVNKEDIAFFPGTFMYVEETLLYYYIINHNYKIVYSPDLKVRHFEDMSTKSRFNNKRKRGLFQLNNSIKSHEILIDYMIRNNNLN